MFDLVPLTCPRRIVAHCYFYAALIAELLQEVLPSPIPGSVAPAAIGTY